MQNIDQIIAKLSQEQIRTERLLLRDLAQISLALSASLEEQQSKLDSIRSQVQVMLSAFAGKIKEGYEENVESEHNDIPIPAIVSGRNLTAEERSTIMNSMIEKLD
jgi:hypothetical protein